MIRLARAQPGIAVLSFDLRCATPILPVATGRHVSSPLRSLPKQAFNATRQQIASTEIPIASDARPLHTSRGFLPWRFANASPGARRSTFMGPASANLHRSSRSSEGANAFQTLSRRTTTRRLFEQSERQLQPRDQSVIVQARKILTQHIYGMVDRGERDEQRLTVGGLIHLRAVERDHAIKSAQGAEASSPA
jgi:hypothetical protein